MILRLALLGAALFGWFYFPGIITGDAAFQFVQIRTGFINNLHPPIMAWMWQGFDLAGLHYGWFWLVPLLFYWVIAARIAQLALPRGWQQWLAFAAMTLMPPLFYIFTAIWKDSFLLVGLMLMVLACLLQAIYIAKRQNHLQDDPVQSRLVRLKWIALSLFILGIALSIAVRHNALPAILPFLMWWLWPRLQGIKNLIASGLIMLLVLAAGWGLNQVPEYRTSMWPTVGLWDLAAMSISENKLILPESAFGTENVTLEEIRREFSPLANTTLCRYIDGRGRLVACMEDLPLIRGNLLPHEAVQPLIRHWVQMIGEHPESYLAHRWRVTCYLLDLCHDPDQPGIITHPFPVEAYQGHWYEGPTAEALNIHIDSPREAAIDTSLAIRWLRFHTVLMSPWVYMLGLLSLLPLLWRKRGTRYGALGLTINTSAWLMALPLFFIVPNLQVRYLIWPICASILCLICYAASRQQE